jgi:phosphopantetheinyl transferase
MPLGLIDERKKFYSMWACRRAMGKTWGINSKLAL